MIAHRRLFALAAVFFITGCLTFVPAAAQKKKAKPAAKTAASKKSAQKRTTSRSSKSRRGKKGPPKIKDERYLVIPTGPPVSDQIEVLEHGSAKPSQDARPVNRPLPEATPDSAATPVNFNISTRRIEVDIDSSRIIEIQQALAQKGFYTGEPTGVYDEATIEAMRKFQASSQIDVTGYPTAHALKRLGLTSW